MVFVMKSWNIVENRIQCFEFHSVHYINLITTFNLFANWYEFKLLVMTLSVHVLNILSFCYFHHPASDWFDWFECSDSGKVDENVNHKRLFLDPELYLYMVQLLPLGTRYSEWRLRDAIYVLQLLFTITHYNLAFGNKSLSIIFC